MLKYNYETYGPLGCNAEMAFEYSKMYALAPIATSENLEILRDLANSLSQDEIEEMTKTKAFRFLSTRIKSKKRKQKLLGRNEKSQ